MDCDCRRFSARSDSFRLLTTIGTTLPKTEQKSTQYDRNCVVLIAHSDDDDMVSHHKSSVCYSSDNNSGEMGMEQKLLYTVNTSFSKGIREKMSRLLHFIINFGSHLITFNEAGNVIIQDRIIDKQSNILTYCELV